MCFGHSPAQVVQVKCGSESERTDMTTENSSVTGNGLVRHNAASAVPFVLAVRKPNRPLPTTSLCVPVAPANRRYLRELRARAAGSLCVRFDSCVDDDISRCCSDSLAECYATMRALGECDAARSGLSFEAK